MTSTMARAVGLAHARDVDVELRAAQAPIARPSAAMKIDLARRVVV
jgi:hypothetical protein